MLDTRLFLNKTARDTQRPAGEHGVRRLHFHLSGPLKGKTTVEMLTNSVPSATSSFVEFPKISPSLSGLPYCVYYATEW